ncbi:MAG: serine acetyltransferase [Acidobacteriia bacterium]|nr:serine acetyltransferase [Terriglobia bacterium]
MSEVGVSRVEMASIVDELSGYPGRFAMLEKRPPCVQPLPSRKAAAEILEELRAILFPGYFGSPEAGADNVRFHVGATLDLVARDLEEQVRRALCFNCSAPEEIPGCSQRAADLTQQFLQRLPELQQTLLEDVKAAYQGDPACTTPDEAILAYPGLYALTFCRIAHALWELDVPLLPRMITEIAHSTTGIDIHPGARIGKRFFIDHGTGVVIGETCVIGNRVTLYQGVTLGAKSFPLDENGHPIKGVPRHPIIEDDVIIYSGATILGRVTIGRESVIGGNVWLTRGVPPGSRVTQGSAHYDAFHFGAGI